MKPLQLVQTGSGNLSFRRVRFWLAGPKSVSILTFNGSSNINDKEPPRTNNNDGANSNEGNTGPKDYEADTTKYEPETRWAWRPTTSTTTTIFARNADEMPAFRKHHHRRQRHNHRMRRQPPASPRGNPISWRPTMPQARCRHHQMPERPSRNRSHNQTPSLCEWTQFNFPSIPWRIFSFLLSATAIVNDT